MTDPNAAVLKSTAQWAEVLLQAQMTLQTITHNEQYSPIQTPITGQLRFSLKDGDEMQRGTSMTQEGFKQKGNVSTTTTPAMVA